MGGGETQAQLLAEGLIASGHSVIILTRRSDKSLKKIEQYGNVTVYRLPPSGGGQLKKWGLVFSSLPCLIHLRQEYDLIFISGYRIVGMSAVLVSRWLRKGCVLKADSQGEMSGEFFDAGLKKLGITHKKFPFRAFLSLRNYILKKADAFSAISPEIAGEFVLSGIPTRQVHNLPNAVDTTRFFPVPSAQKALLREKLGVSPSTKVAVYTGRLVSYKGLPLLLRVWKELSHKVQDILLLLVGTGGLDIHNCESELKAYVQENILGPYVRFTGSVQNVPEYLQASDIFAFPTENDAFPSSLIEAMTCRLPVVTTPVGAIKTIVTDGENGLFVQPGDFQSLYAALENLLNDPALALRLGEGGWKTVQENYSAEIVTKKYINLFQSVIFFINTKSIKEEHKGHEDS